MLINAVAFPSETRQPSLNLNASDSLDELDDEGTYVRALLLGVHITLEGFKC